MEHASKSSDINAIRGIYQQASQVLRSGQVKEAELLIRSAFPVHGREPNLLCLLGEICIRQKKAQEAKGLFHDANGMQPGFPRALEGLGLALLADGNAKEAVKYLRQVVEKLPNREKSRMALSRALAEAGHLAESEQEIEKVFETSPRQQQLNEADKLLAADQVQEGEKILRQMLVENPDDVKALRMLATVAIEATRFKAARQLLDRALQLEPGFLPALNELAHLEMKQDNYAEALQALDRALSIDPAMIQSWVMKGNVLSRANRFEESIEAFQRALQINASNIGALSGLGHVQKTIGVQEQAIDTFRRCIKHHPRMGEAYWSLANLKTFEFTLNEVEQMEKMVALEEVTDESRVNFYYSLGKHYENESRYDTAFENYQQGNTLRRQYEKYDPVMTQEIHDRLIKVFTPDFLAQRAGWGDPDASPILVVGLPRSGSTLIEQILASHSQIEGTMELPDLGRISGSIGRGKPRAKQYPEALLEMSEEELRALGSKYIEDTMRYRSGVPYFIDKMPNNFPQLGLLHLILPNAKVINARRHPMDSCLGTFKQLFFNGQPFSYDQFELGHYYLEYQRIMDHWHEVLPGKVLDVQYEDMVTDQENQSRRIFEYLGLPWEDQVLRFYETERAINTASSEQVRQPIYTKAMNFWRNYEPYLGELIETLQPLLSELPEDQRPASIQ